MKTTKKAVPVEWPKNQTRPCPSGKCKHRHVAKSGPCTEVGCGCHGKHVSLPPKGGK